jgi:hypothetical protein
MEMRVGSPATHRKSPHLLRRGGARADLPLIGAHDFFQTGMGSWGHLGRNDRPVLHAGTQAEAGPEVALKWGQLHFSRVPQEQAAARMKRKRPVRTQDIFVLIRPRI